MPKTTFWDIIVKTLSEVETPLSPKEIWDTAHQIGTIGDFVSTGKTPWATIGAYCYTDIQRAGENSTIIQTSERPAQFFLRRLITKIDLNKVQKEQDEAFVQKEERELKKFNERLLHPLLAAYTYGDPHFKANVKTIFHENSIRGTKGRNEWLHPDLVGVYFPFRDYKQETLDIQSHLSISAIKLFSFEIKTKISFSNLREAYFQAVSNSSWANEGYLVTLNLEDDLSLLDEIRRLNNAFGIGLIKINCENIYESEILFPARVNTEIDWDTVNRLATENSDFSTFLKLISEDCKLGKVKSDYDRVLSLDELTIYIEKKDIKSNTN
ncbi:HTH domain-containing protein [Terrimonas ferruginea]|uniref:HTH domain-containing protein n=1 Tax=Terrimonas ferruginea TaxID=249 RepID=UPI000407F158|nr:HTH domain-containing protein [Terrimonas ferruginea]